MSYICILFTNRLFVIISLLNVNNSNFSTFQNYFLLSLEI